VIALALVVHLTSAAEIDQMNEPELVLEYARLKEERPTTTGSTLGIVFGSIGMAAGGITTLVGLGQYAFFGATHNDYRPALTIGGIAFGLSCILLGVGVYFRGEVLEEREQLAAMMLAIHDRLNALELAYRNAAWPPPPPPMPISSPSGAELLINFSDARTHQPVSGAVAVIGDRQYLSDGNGALLIDGMPPGPLAVTYSAGGYQPKQDTVSIVLGQRVSVIANLVGLNQRAPAKIVGLIRSSANGAPVPATLEVAGVTIRADARGIFSVEVEGGPHLVRIVAPGFIAQSREVSVESGDRAIFNVDLHPAQ
jgi:hypothetical protein